MCEVAIALILRLRRIVIGLRRYQQAIKQRLATLLRVAMNRRGRSKGSSSPDSRDGDRRGERGSKSDQLGDLGGKQSLICMSSGIMLRIVCYYRYNQMMWEPGIQRDSPKV